MKKVVIIGAGPAGLTAAYELLKNNNQYKIYIIEKSDKLGGISSSIQLNHNIIDTGIHRFFSKNKKVNDIWEELLPIQGKPAYDDKLLSIEKDYSKNGPNPEKEDKVMLIKNRFTRIYYDNKFFDYPVSLNMTTIKNLGFIHIIKSGFSYIKARIFKRKENSLEDLYINKFGKELYSLFFESYTEKVWGKHPRDISADWGNQRVKGISITEIVKDFFRKKFHLNNKDNTEVSLIDKFYYPKKGSIQIWEEMAKEIEKNGGEIILNSEVCNINIKGNKINSISYKNKKEKKEMKADIVISSMPIKDLFMSFEGIKIPKKIYHDAINLPYREFISVGFLLKNCNIKNNTKIPTVLNVAPDNWIYIQDAKVKMGRVQIFNNWSPYIFEKKENIKDKILLTTEYFTEENDYLWKMSEKDMIQFVIEEAEKIDLFHKEDVITAKEIKIEKAYPGYFGTYQSMPEIIKYLNGIENLYCIGRNGQHKYNNMDHSMLTGIETADIIINSENEKDKIWEVNTDQEYHEIKKGES